MTPREAHGRRKRLERTYPVVGEIRATTPAYTPEEKRIYEELCAKLARTGRFDALQALKDGRLTFEELRAADDRQSIDDLRVDHRLFHRLWPWTDDDGASHLGAFGDALARMKGGSSRDRYAVSFRKLARQTIPDRTGALGPAIPAEATVQDLLVVDWHQLRADWGGSPSDWMHLYRALSHFLTVHLGGSAAQARNGRARVAGRRQGVWHPFRLEVMDLLERKRERKRKPDISVAVFRRLMNRVPDHVRPVYWALVILGLRFRTEYLRLRAEHLRPHTFGVLIPDAKSEEAVLQVDPQLWPWITAAVPPPLGEAWTRTHWHRACLAEGLARVVRVPCIGRDLGHWRSGELARQRRCARLALPYEPRTPPATVERYVGPTLHDLRHCHGQWLTAAGVPEVMVQVSMRHLTPDQTRDYTMQEIRGKVSAAMAKLLCA